MPPPVTSCRARRKGRTDAVQGRSREVGLCVVAYFKNMSRSRHTKQYGSKQVCPPGSASNSFARNARQCHSSCTTQFRKQCCARGGFSKPHKLDMLTDMFGLPITRVEGSNLPQARSGCTREAYGTQAMAKPVPPHNQHPRPGRRDNAVDTSFHACDRTVGLPGTSRLPP